MVEYREIPEEKILRFSATPGFKGWKPFFSEDSISHPAKMNLNLLRHILKTYTKKGNVVLDPMAGTGSTVVLASSMGRHGIAVEYEKKFCMLIEENIDLLEKQRGLLPRGKAVCINGDARKLSKHLIESDVIISSPPYGNRLSDVAIQDGDPARMGYRQTVDVVLTSPPYGSDNANLQGRDDRHAKSILKRTGVRSVKLDPENLGNLKYGNIDTVVTSPPYAKSMSARNPISTWSEKAKRKWWDNYKSQGGGMGFEAFIEYQESMQYSYSSDSENLGNLEYGDIDAVVMSPPYENSRPFHDVEFMKGIVHEQNIKSKLGETKGHTRSDEAELRYLEKIEDVTLEKDNIGNLKGETYLDAMLRVYHESYKVLKPFGKMVLVTKNFIRDKKVVRLDIDTIKLCESVGFKLIDQLYFELPTKSFWKHIYHRKYPDVPEVLYEDVIVFKKSDVGVPPRGGKDE